MDFLYLFVAGLAGYATDLSSIIVLGLFVGLLVAVSLTMTTGGRKVLNDLMSFGKSRGYK